MNAFSFGDVALSLNVITMIKKAVTGRSETVMYLAQLLVVQLVQERESMNRLVEHSQPHNYHTLVLDGGIFHI